MYFGMFGIYVHWLILYFCFEFKTNYYYEKNNLVVMFVM